VFAQPLEHGGCGRQAADLLNLALVEKADGAGV
jgi:hypothetical protein